MDQHLRVSLSVEVTFTDLTDADREALESFASGQTVTFRRIWQPEEEKLLGEKLAFKPFEEVRKHSKATELKSAYMKLRQDQPSLNLPPYKNMEDAKAAMRKWESSNEDQLETTAASAAHLFGVTGQPRFARRFDYIFMPAVDSAEEQTRDVRGTLLNLLLQQLLSRSADQRRFAARLQQVSERAAEEASKIIEEEHGAALGELGSRLTTTLQTYVSDGNIALEPQTPQFRAPSLQVGMKLGDGGFETDVGRQGHGLQRALLMATLQELVRAENSVQEEINPAALFLAIEEPELYQHPTQARHFAKTLAELTRTGSGAIQVAYATHSEHFVEPSRFERLRRFRKQVSATSCPTSQVTQATLHQVANRLQGLVQPNEIAKRIEITLGRTLAEAMFAHTVVLVEGFSDADFLRGIADREEGLDALGISVIPVNGKRKLHIPWAILTELEIPTFVIFDGDRGQEERMKRSGKKGTDIASQVRDSASWNNKLLSLFGDLEEDWPDTRIRSNFAVFEDCLETELAEEWPTMLDRARLLAEETGDWRGKPGDCYRQAAREVEGKIPGFAADIIAAIKALR